MTLIDLLLRIGATWLLAYSFTQLDGPGDVFKLAREKLPHAKLLDCIICTATWVGVIVMLAPDGVLLQGFGVAGLGMWLHSYTGWKYSA